MRAGSRAGAQTCGGHFGVAKTLNCLQDHFYWPNCCTDTELFVHMCNTCTAQKGPIQRSHAPLQDFQVGAPMQREGMDILGPFSRTECENCNVLLAMDYFTQWPEAYTVTDQSTATTATVLVEEFFFHFGVPKELHSDQGLNFEAEVFAVTCARLGIKKTHTTPLHLSV